MLRQLCVPLLLGTACCHICQTTCPLQRPGEVVQGPMLPDVPWCRGCCQAGKQLPFPRSCCWCGIVPAAPLVRELRACTEQQHSGGVGRGQQLSWQGALASRAILRCF